MPTDNQPSSMVFARMDSPIGQLTVLADNQGITEIRFPNHETSAPPALSLHNGDCPHRFIEEAIAQLQAYFAGQLTTFDLSLHPAGTEFQKTVWAQLQKVRYGTTASYGAVAAAIGKPRACRAVGMANSRNPIPIVVPCHRIIGSNGALTGFTGGLDIKRWLLAHERS